MFVLVLLGRFYPSELIRRIVKLKLTSWKIKVVKVAILDSVEQLGVGFAVLVRYSFGVKSVLLVSSIQQMTAKDSLPSCSARTNPSRLPIQTFQ